MIHGWGDKQTDRGLERREGQREPERDDLLASCYKKVNQNTLLPRLRCSMVPKVS